MKTRYDLESYMLELSLPLLERTADRIVSGESPARCDLAGYTATFFEGLCRPLWGLSPLLSGNGRTLTIQIQGKPTDVCLWLRQVVLEGVDPSSANSWDKHRQDIGMSYYANQVTTELAGLMLCVYLARETLWEPFSDDEKRRVADWMHALSVQAFENSWPNNHYWFPMLILLLLKRLGFSYGNTDAILRDGLERLDRMYLGHGFYQDGTFGRFDYYLAWSLHSYPLLWTLLEDDSFPGYAARKREYLRRTEEFLGVYAHFFDSDGGYVPFGRSLSYRFAAAAVFPLAAMAGCRMDHGLARAIFLRNIEFFRRSCRVGADGVMGPGFVYPSECHAENYVSDSGAYWFCKAFLALSMKEDHPFWSAPESPLPIERGDYAIKPAAGDVHWIVAGEDRAGGVTLYNNAAQYMENGHQVHRFNDMAGYYTKFAYNSRAGFGLSTRDNTSLDNMIGLATADGTMCSHRILYQDMGMCDDMLVSRHVPFANDPASAIKTWLVPLGSGYHARIHEVTLASAYHVCEGGFSIGFRDDEKSVLSADGTIVLASKEYRSSVRVWSGIETVCLVRQIHSGMHLLSPVALYPAYQTKEPLPAGRYVFAAVFGFSVASFSPPPPPRVAMTPDGVTVEYQGITRAVIFQVGGPMA